MPPLPLKYLSRLFAVTTELIAGWCKIVLLVWLWFASTRWNTMTNRTLCAECLMSVWWFSDRCVGSLLSILRCIDSERDPLNIFGLHRDVTGEWLNILRAFRWQMGTEYLCDHIHWVTTEHVPGCCVTRSICICLLCMDMRTHKLYRGVWMVGWDYEWAYKHN